MKSDWISVDEPPKKTSDYLCSVVDKDDGLKSIEICWYIAAFEKGWVCPTIFKVTHWQPLPEPAE